MGRESFKVVNLYTILEAVKQDLEEELLQKQAIIEIKEVGEVNVIPFQFQQVFSNLIGNALKFSSPTRKPHITISSQLVDGNHFDTNTYSAGTQHYHISITDNGIGFNQEHSEKIFELFQRLHNDREYEGTGVGLAIVKKVIENHDGVIKAKAKVGEGATFDIYIPII